MGRAPARSGVARPKKVQMQKQDRERASAPIAQERVRRNSKKKRRDVQRRTRGSASTGAGEVARSYQSYDAYRSGILTSPSDGLVSSASTIRRKCNRPESSPATIVRLSRAAIHADTSPCEDLFPIF